MMSELARWRQMLGEWPAMRQVFHALCLMSDREDPTDLLEFAAQQQWMADLARRFEIVVSRFDATTAIERETTASWRRYGSCTLRPGCATRFCWPISPTQP